MISPFLNGTSGGTQVKKAVREEVANTLKFCGVPLGAR